MEEEEEEGFQSIRVSSEWRRKARSGKDTQCRKVSNQLGSPASGDDREFLCLK